MSDTKFNKTYELILEGIFEPASDEEVAERRKKYMSIITKDWMEEFLQRKDIHKNDDGSYDVDGGVYIHDILELGRLPIKFNKVKGDFESSMTNLETLEGAPKEIGGSFYFSYNNLDSKRDVHKYFPKKIGGNVDADMAGDVFNVADKDRLVRELNSISDIKGNVLIDT